MFIRETSFSRERQNLDSEMLSTRDIIQRACKCKIYADKRNNDSNSSHKTRDKIWKKRRCKWNLINDTLDLSN